LGRGVLEEGHGFAGSRQIAAERVTSAAGYVFNHSSYTYLIDREGNLRALMPYGHAAEDYVHDVRILLKQ